jgi:radical SAM superfamily enzyme YgiQ (UPF0313 family)
MSDVLLINAPVRGARLDQHASLGLPLGLAYIAAVLRQHGYRPSIVDLNINGMDAARVQDLIRMADPAILGISTHTETYLSGLECARAAKEIRPDLPVVFGGPHATVMHEEVIQEDCVDYVVRAEGELTMVELADFLIKGIGAPADIKGITYKRDGVVASTPDRPFIEDPDTLPFPDRGLLPLECYAFPGNVLTSRGGCPFNCDFCAVNNIWKGRRRFRRAEKVVEEVRSIMTQFRLPGVAFADDTFTLNRAHTLRLCGLLKREALEGNGVSWTCSTRADLVDRELLEEMVAAGCYGIQYGVEAGSQEILDLIGKGITLEQVRQAVRDSKELGVQDVLCSFMFPHPADTVETIRAQKEFMKELSGLGARINMSYTTPYPGTLYYENAKELGISVLSSSWDDFNAKHVNFTTKCLSQDELTSLAEEIADEVGLERG